MLVAVLECDLAVLEELLRQRFRHHELAFTVADRNLVDVALTEGGEPRGVGAAHAGAHDAGDVTVNVVAVQRRGVGRDLAELAKRQQTGLDQRLETVADAEDQALAGEQILHRRLHLRTIQHIGDELAAAVRLVT